MTTDIERGFADAEYEERTRRAQRQMAAATLDALLLTAAHDISYFSGFKTQFWHSPTRPWFLIIPAKGKPIAIIPQIGAAGMHNTWIDNVQCWASPQPQDEGISLLTAALQNLNVIGMPLGAETALRMPVADWLKLRQNVSPAKIVDCAPLLQNLRMIKSAQEIAKIRHIAHITAAAFVDIARDNCQNERECCRQLHIKIMQGGADDVPYLAAASGTDGYASVIMPPTDKKLSAGEIMMIDIGAVFDEYFCDFNRNYAVQHATDNAQIAHQTLFAALQAGATMARPGNTAAQVWQAMRDKMPAAGDIGRMGHGIGMQLTESPSIAENDHTVLQPGMTLALEPCMRTADNRQMVREENVVITEDGAEWLSICAAKDLPLIS